METYIWNQKEAAHITRVHFEEGGLGKFYIQKTIWGQEGEMKRPHEILSMLLNMDGSTGLRNYGKYIFSKSYKGHKIVKIKLLNIEWRI